VPFIYYGDEIGLRMPHGLASKEGGYQRTGTRTPMQWSAAGNFVPLFLRPHTYPLIFLRRTGRTRIVVALNPANRPVRASFTVPGAPGSAELLLGRGVSIACRNTTWTAHLQGVSYGIFAVRH